MSFCMARQVHAEKIRGRIPPSMMVMMFLLLTVCLPLLEVPMVTGKGVHVGVVAPWTETPLLQEGCEMMAARGTLFDDFYSCVHNAWQRVRAMNSTEGALRLTQKAQYDVFMDLVESAKWSPSQVKLAKMKFAARLYSPTVEAHWQLARTAMQLIGGCSKDGRPFALVAGKVICSEHDLEGVLTSSLSSDDENAYGKNTEEAFALFPDLDHIHPMSRGKGGKGGRTVILYGIIGEKRTMDLLQIAERHLQTIRLSFRHLPVSGQMWKNPLHVQGYGVTVDLKSVEYVVTDEKELKNTGTADGEGVGDAKDTTTDDSMKEKENNGPIGGINITLLNERYPALRSQLDKFAVHLLDIVDHEEVKVDFQMWETQYMGFAAAQYVMEAENEKRLGVLMNLLTKFPLYASRLSKISATVNSKMSKEMHEELVRVGGLINRRSASVFLNGRSIKKTDLNLFSLIENLEADEQVFEDVKRILTSHRIPSSSTDDGFVVAANPDALNVAVHSVIQNVEHYVTSHQLDSEDITPRLWMPQKSIFWLNDIENDVSFVYLHDNLKSILTTTMNGIPNIPRRNLIHVVCVVDPTTATAQEHIAIMIKLEEAKQPLRLGIVFADTEWSPQITMAEQGGEMVVRPSVSGVTALITATVWELTRGEGGKEHVQDVLDFLLGVKLSFEAHGSLSKMELESAAANILSVASKRKLMDVLRDTRFQEYYHKTQEKLHELQLDSFPVTLVNGNVFKGNLMKVIRQGFLSEILDVRELVRNGMLTDTERTDFYNSILRLKGARERYSKALYEEKVYMDWTSKPVLDFLQYRPFLRPTKNLGTTPPLVSNVLVLQSHVGRKAIHALTRAIKNLMDCEDESEACIHVRLTYAFCGEESMESKQQQQQHTIVGDLERLLLSPSDNGIRGRGVGDDKKQRVKLIYEFLQTIAAEMSDYSEEAEYYNEVNFIPEIRQILDATSNESLNSQLQMQRMLSDGFCAHVKAQILPSIIDDKKEEAHGKENVEDRVFYFVNGRRFVYDDFSEEDLKDAVRHEIAVAESVSHVIGKVDFMTLSNNELQQSDLGDAFYASKIAALTELLRRDSTRGSPLEEEKNKPPTSGRASFTVNPSNDNMKQQLQLQQQHHHHHRMTVFLDPIEQQSQFLVSLCDYVTRSPLGASCTVHLGTAPRVGKPMRNFYQFVSDTEIRFDSMGRVLPPAAVFHRLPSTHLLTLGIEEPESWTVFPLEAKYDLDNIVLDNLPATSQYLHAIYRINSILLTGSAREAGLFSPSQGLPLLIRSTKTDHSTSVITRDTLVMAILGYFQLQSTPGVWYLTVLPGNIASAFYISKVNDIQVNDEINKKHFGEFNYSIGQNIPVVISSFRGRFLTLDVSKTPGNEKATPEGLEAATSPRRTAWPPLGPQARKPDRPTLNIFSVASGHLYERFLRMMIHSVMQTSSDVHGANTTRIKFWLIENFLSPRFKTLVPLLAKHYGFDVSFMTYRWPWWLNKQTEKQRTIWAYKVLFLDVLFPLDVDRVIFVDADQTLRADLHELYNMNIGGAPTAYTPFCRKDSNPATKNFRFWDHGFWLNHLRGRPYHISAIYLVDLRRLRAISGGEKYRLTYSQLSTDPNSLANLDQDLPNFMQDQVPIYSLPEEWLWCETWCGAESKARAKTIDLCNNPLTKIPKLDNAKLIIPEWETLDNRLEELSEKLLKEHEEAVERSKEG